MRAREQVRIDYLKTVFELPLYGAALFAMELQNNIINLVRDQGYLGTSPHILLSPLLRAHSVPLLT
jgi:hypothetical protein